MGLQPLRTCQNTGRALLLGVALAGGGGFLDRAAPLVEAYPYGTATDEPRPEDAEAPDRGRPAEPPRDPAPGTGLKGRDPTSIEERR